MTTTTSKKVRVPRRAWIYIEGTQAWQNPQDDWDLAAKAVFQKVHDAPTRKDGSCTVELDAREREIFEDYATAWVLGPADNAGGDMDALADLRSLRALINHLS